MGREEHCRRHRGEGERLPPLLLRPLLLWIWASPLLLLLRLPPDRGEGRGASVDGERSPPLLIRIGASLLLLRPPPDPGRGRGTTVAEETERRRRRC
jgi:hypothetical protein